MAEARTRGGRRETGGKTPVIRLAVDNDPDSTRRINLRNRIQQFFDFKGRTGVWHAKDGHTYKALLVKILSEYTVEVTIIDGQVVPKNTDSEDILKVLEEFFDQKTLFECVNTQSDEYKAYTAGFSDASSDTAATVSSIVDLPESLRRQYCVGLVRGGGTALLRQLEEAAGEQFLSDDEIEGLLASKNNPSHDKVQQTENVPARSTAPRSQRIEFPTSERATVVEIHPYVPDLRRACVNLLAKLESNPKYPLRHNLQQFIDGSRLSARRVDLYGHGLAIVNESHEDVEPNEMAMEQELGELPDEDLPPEEFSDEIDDTELMALNLDNTDPNVQKNQDQPVQHTFLYTEHVAELVNYLYERCPHVLSTISDETGNSIPNVVEAVLRPLFTEDEWSKEMGDFFYTYLQHPLSPEIPTDDTNYEWQNRGYRYARSRREGAARFDTEKLQEMDIEAARSVCIGFIQAGRPDMVKIFQVAFRHAHKTTESIFSPEEFAALQPAQ